MQTYTRITDTQLNWVELVCCGVLYHEKNAVVSRIICPNHWCVIDFCAPLFRRCNANIFCHCFGYMLTENETRKKKTFSDFIFHLTCSRWKSHVYNYVHSYIVVKSNEKKSEMDVIYECIAAAEKKTNNNHKDAEEEEEEE